MDDIPAYEVVTSFWTDSDIENLWDAFTDILLNPKTECIEEGFLSFDIGTPREDIWKWFDKRHSKGVAYLLYERRNQSE